MSTAVRFGARTDVGRVREHNEDNLLTEPELGLFIVADGMGGHASGEVASMLAVKTMGEEVYREVDILNDLRSGDQFIRPEDVKNMLGTCIHRANAIVHQAAQQDSTRRGMGTTLTALLLVGRHGFIAHVGDSRVYLVREKEVRPLTEDHSVINELKRRGRYKPEMIEKLQVKNAVTRAVGVFETVEPDTFHFLTAPGDRFVLCSDGLHGYFEQDDEIGKVILDLSDETAAEKLVNIANERGGKDNITAIVVSVPAESAADAEELRLSYEALEHTPFFKLLSSKELMRIQTVARMRRFKDGETIVKENDVGESLFVVVKGKCRVRKGGTDITTFSPGEHFGEMALVDDAPRSATVLSNGASVLIEVARPDFFRLVREDKEIGLKLLWNFVKVLVHRLRTTSQQLNEAKEAVVEDLSDELFLEEDADGESVAREIKAAAQAIQMSAEGAAPIAMHSTPPAAGPVPIVSVPQPPRVPSTSSTPEKSVPLPAAPKSTSSASIPALKPPLRLPMPLAPKAVPEVEAKSTAETANSKPSEDAQEIPIETDDRVDDIPVDQDVSLDGEEKDSLAPPRDTLPDAKKPAGETESSTARKAATSTDDDDSETLDSADLGDIVTEDSVDATATKPLESKPSQRTSVPPPAPPPPAEPSGQQS